MPCDGKAWLARLQSGVANPRRVAATEATRRLGSEPDQSSTCWRTLQRRCLGVPWVFLTLVDEHWSFWVRAAGVDPDPTPDCTAPTLSATRFVST